MSDTLTDVTAEGATLPLPPFAVVRTLSVTEAGATEALAECNVRVDDDGTFVILD